MCTCGSFLCCASIWPSGASLVGYLRGVTSYPLPGGLGGMPSRLLIKSVQTPGWIQLQSSVPRWPRRRDYFALLAVHEGLVSLATALHNSIPRAWKCLSGELTALLLTRCNREGTFDPSRSSCGVGWVSLCKEVRSVCYLVVSGLFSLGLRRPISCVLPAVTMAGCCGSFFCYK